MRKCFLINPFSSVSDEIIQYVGDVSTTEMKKNLGCDYLGFVSYNYQISNTKTIDGYFVNDDAGLVDVTSYEDALTKRVFGVRCSDYHLILSGKTYFVCETNHSISDITKMFRDVVLLLGNQPMIIQHLMFNFTDKIQFKEYDYKKKCFI